ncbi:MAG: hypothetical protein WC683_14085 [bacterium]
MTKKKTKKKAAPARSEKPIVVFGLGKLGLPLACLLARHYHVTGLDTSRRRVAAIEHDEFNDQDREPQVEALFADVHGLTDTTHSLSVAHLGSNTRDFLTLGDDFVTLIGAAQAIFIAVPTPEDEQGRLSSEHVVQAMNDIHDARYACGKHANPDTIIFIVSTLMPGETEALREYTPDLQVIYAPTLIALGSVVENLMHPSQVMIGWDDWYAGTADIAVSDRIEAYLGALTERGTLAGLHTTYARTAEVEVAKLSINAMLTSRVAFAQAVMALCDQYPNCDAHNTLDLIGSDPRIGHAYLAPGLGAGGPCLPRDTLALAADAIHPLAQGHFQNIAATNDLMAHYAAAACGLVRTVAILGAPYKLGTPNETQSAAHTIAAILKTRGTAAWLHNPEYDTAEAALALTVHADAAIIALPHPMYATLHLASIDWSIAKCHTIIDPWRTLHTPPPKHIDYIVPGHFLLDHAP